MSAASTTSKPHAKHVRENGRKIDVPEGAAPLIDSPNSVVSKPNGPNAQVIQTNTLSTPVLILLLAMLFIAAALAAVAIGVAVDADGVAFRAERTAALARNHADASMAKVQHLEDVMTIRGITIPPQVKEQENVQ